MILSERWKFLFIKGVKVAGTSVEMALAPICGPDDIVTPITPIDERDRLRLGGGCRNYSGDPAFERGYLQKLAQATPQELGAMRLPMMKFYNHMPLAQVASLYAKPLGDFRIVCIVRSPYAKVLSWTNMRLSYRRYKEGGAMSGSLSDLAPALDQAFDTGVIATIRNIDRYRGPDGAFAAEPMRYETLQSDFAAFLRGLGVTQEIPLPHAKKGLMADRLDPREVLRPDQIARLNEMFADEFAAFGYPTL